MTKKIAVLPDYYRGIEPIPPSWEKVPLKKNLSPRVYFDFAQADLHDKSTSRSRVNALSNAKRALHYQVDLISRALGIEQLETKKRLDFPHKLDFCKECGISSPSIIRRLNKIRNVVEHDYIIPTITQVQDYMDVVELFLAATDRVIYQFPTYMEFTYAKKVNEKLPEIRNILFPIGKGIIYLHYHPGHVEELNDMDVYEWERKYSIKVQAGIGEIYFI
jgi:hypothetical protein